MSYSEELFVRIAVVIFALEFLLSACDTPTNVNQSVGAVPSPTVSATQKFAGGTKAIKIITSDAISTGSFSVPSTLPVATPVPPGFPGADTVVQYLPGVSASTYFDVDGTTTVSKPLWLQDFQLGMTDLPGTSGACATFGGTGNADASTFYRVSEINCGAQVAGTGSNLTDKSFFRMVLNRNSDYLGSAENLLIQVEYQAQGIRLNSDGASASPEDNIDQLWKMFWNTSLSATQAANVFSVFIPPNYGACIKGGTGHFSGRPGNCVTGYRGAPIQVKQIIVPLSSYPTMSVIQFSRVKGRVNSDATYLSDFLAIAGGGTADCLTDSPLCAGVVIRSVMLMRL